MAPRRAAVLLLACLSAACGTGAAITGDPGEDPGVDPGAALLHGCKGWAPPGVASCCRGGAGCHGSWWCDTAACKCEEFPATQSPCLHADAGAPAADGGGSAPDAGAPPGPVGPAGGTVSLLHFGLTGDTRPSACEATDYPTPIISGIADAMQAAGVQFALDLGDHLYVCNNDLALARSEMGQYRAATGRYAGTWFMTMGNHECHGGFCDLTSTNANYVAFMESLAPIAPKPYYSFDVHTSLGLARFVVVADNAWTPAQASWLEATLAEADAKARYTIVARHHPSGDTSVSTNGASMQIIRAHKLALFLAGHAHHYSHPVGTDSGRDVVIGIGGAKLISTGTFYGYALVDQQPNGNLDVKVYDVTKGTLQDQWSVGPNP